MKVKEAIEELQNENASADLWEKLDKALAEIGATKRPPNSFTTRELMVKHKITKGQAEVKIRKLRQAGKVRKAGNCHSCYYELVT